VAAILLGVGRATARSNECKPRKRGTGTTVPYHLTIAAVGTKSVEFSDTAARSLANEGRKKGGESTEHAASHRGAERKTSL
jgi:hypothetical protein